MPIITLIREGCFCWHSGLISPDPHELFEIKYSIIYIKGENIYLLTSVLRLKISLINLISVYARSIRKKDNLK